VSKRLKILLSVRNFGLNKNAETMVMKYLVSKVENILQTCYEIR